GSDREPSSQGFPAIRATRAGAGLGSRCSWGLEIPLRVPRGVKADSAAQDGACDCPCSVRVQAPSHASSNRERTGNVMEFTDGTDGSWPLSMPQTDFNTDPA